MAKQMLVIRSMGSSPQVVEVKRGDTVRTALTKAGINTDTSMKIMNDNLEISLNTKIRDMDEIMLVPSVKGGN